MIDRDHNRLAEEIIFRLQGSPVTWLLAAILAVALGLRLWGISFGLPYEFTYDESKEIIRALKLGAGEYHWGFGKGGLYYVLFLEYGLLYLFRWMMDHAKDTHDFALQVIRDPSMLFLLGRLTNAILGAFTSLVIFHVAKRVYDSRVGLVAAFIGATAFTHVDWSHLINVDIGMTLAVWASILAYLEYEQRANRRWLIGAGVFAGLGIAFKVPAAIIFPVLFLAICSRSDNWRYPGRLFTEGGIVLLTTLVTLTLLAPEWTVDLKSFLVPIQGDAVPKSTFEGTVNDAVLLVTIYPDTEWTQYLKVLLQEHNLLLTLAALAGIGLAIKRRQRWPIIWFVLMGIFITVMSASSRGTTEYYLLPIMPALWLLASHAITVASGHRPLLMIGGLLCVTALSLVAVVRGDVERTKPDTRVVAKEWIEANVPSGAKILMDGFKYRFTPSPPLTPDKSVVSREVAGFSEQVEYDDYRGVSQNTLKLYAEAMKSVDGPAYDLHSTKWGLAVKTPSYYVQHCFHYIITSSNITQRYQTEINEKRFPKSAYFYKQLETDQNFRKVYSVEPISWQRPGPTITVYKVIPQCGVSQKQTPRSDSQ